MILTETRRAAVRIEPEPPPHTTPGSASGALYRMDQRHGGAGVDHEAGRHTIDVVRWRTCLLSRARTTCATLKRMRTCTR